MVNRADPYGAWRMVKTEPVRLQFQHFMWREHFGWNIHPSIDLSGKKDVRIAEFASGHCLWAIQVAESLGPTAHVEASDISTDLAPAPALLPSNMTFRQLSIFEDLPAEWEGTFDLVHLRLAAPAFGFNRDPTPTLVNVIKLLKPGGYVQWDEYIYTESPSCNSYTLSSDPTVPQSEIQAKWPANGEMARHVAEGGQWPRHWFDRLPAHFASQGLTHIQRHEDRVRPSLARAFMEHWLILYPQIIEVLRPFDPLRAERMEELLPQVHRDMQEDGVLFSRTPSCTVGRKPEAYKMTL